MEIVLCVIAAAFVAAVILFNLLDKDISRAQRQWAYMEDYFDRWVELTERLLNLLAADGENRAQADALLAQWQKNRRKCGPGIAAVNALSAFTDALVAKAHPNQDDPVGALANQRWDLEEELVTFEQVYNDMIKSYEKRRKKPVYAQLARLLRMQEGVPLEFSLRALPKQ